MMKKSKQQSHVRHEKAATVLLVVLWGLFFGAMVMSEKSLTVNAASADFNLVPGASEQIRTTRVTVKPGDSLWRIAAKFAGAETDIRQSIYQIRQINQLTNAHIYPGQILIIPLEPARDGTGVRRR
jgi:nucleoid-associated protein YgaU